VLKASGPLTDIVRWSHTSNDVLAPEGSIEGQ
jgi:hypothetical protein